MDGWISNKYGEGREMRAIREIKLVLAISQHQLPR